MLGPFLSCGLLLTLGFLQIIQAQESSGKPEAPIPKTIQPPIPLPKSSSTVTLSEKPAPEPERVADLPALATSIEEYASVAGCEPKACNVLVTNFTLPDGKSSAYGMQLADEFSSELARSKYNIQVIDRSRLQNFLAKDRIPSQSIDAGVIRSIAAALDARFMVFGTTEKSDDDVVSLTTQLIDVASKDWSGYNAIVNLGRLKSEENFEPIEPFAPLSPITSSADGQKLHTWGADGLVAAHCTYMPNPPYSDAARKLKVTGSITTETVLNAEGQFENMRIVRGLPGGLNEQTIATMQSWRCNPALKDGKPVPTLVQFTVSFRLY